MLKSLNKGVSGVLESQSLGWVVVVVGGYLAYRLIRRTGGLIGSITGSVDKALLGDKIKSGTPGVTNDIYNKGYKIAVNVSNALGTNPAQAWYSKLTEDEDAATFELNKIDSQVLATVVKQVYEKISGFDLWFHIEQYFFSWQIRAIDARVIDYIK